MPLETPVMMRGRRQAIAASTECTSRKQPERTVGVAQLTIRSNVHASPPSAPMKRLRVSPKVAAVAAAAVTPRTTAPTRSTRIRAASPARHSWLRRKQFTPIVSIISGAVQKMSARKIGCPGATPENGRKVPCWRSHRSWLVSWNSPCRITLRAICMSLPGSPAVRSLPSMASQDWVNDAKPISMERAEVRNHGFAVSVRAIRKRS